MRLRRRLGRVLADEAPEHRLVVGVGGAREVQQHRERHHHVRGRRLAAVDVPDRVGQPRRGVLPGEGAQLLVILVDRLRDHVEIEPLRRLRLLVHEVRQALRPGIGQPLVDRQPVALRLRDLLAVLVEEQLVDEMLRRAARRGSRRSRRRSACWSNGPCRTSRSRRRAPPSARRSRASTAASRCRRSPAACVSLPSSSSKVIVPSARVHLLHRHVEHAARLSARSAGSTNRSRCRSSRRLASITSMIAS